LNDDRQRQRFSLTTGGLIRGDTEGLPGRPRTPLTGPGSLDPDPLPAQLAASDPAPRVGLAPAMNRRQKRQYWVLVVAWAFVNGQFWAWWLDPGHVGNVTLFILMSLALGYAGTMLSSVYLFFLGQMRRPVPIPAEYASRIGAVGRVAVISLTVPGSESIEIVRRQLVAMQQIRHPHDSWILVDKEHSPEIAEVAHSLGVNYFSRHDVHRWGAQRVAGWIEPVSKAGNVNAWLKAYGANYSHFTQLDIDHLPEPRYLDEVLGYFVDPKVTWVQAPSVYGNLQSWTARGSSEQELVLQGPLQMGYFGFSRTPFIIGSHCTYDTAAITAIGGFQPTRAEDHLDTVCLAAEGGEGVFVPEVIAVGDGPQTFETYLAQQFAWAYSMMEVLFFHTPRLLRRYGHRQAIQFIFAQTWYTFWSLSMMTLFFLPLASLAFNSPLSRAGYVGFIVHSIPVAAVGTAIWMWSHHWHLPAGVRLSWRGVALHLARWIVVLSALVQVLCRVHKPYMITRKGVDAETPRELPFRLLMPYAALVLLPLAVGWLYLTVHERGYCQGYLLFDLQGGALFWILLMVVVTQEIRRERSYGLSLRTRLLLQARPIALCAGLSALFVVTAVTSAPLIVEAVLSRF